MSTQIVTGKCRASYANIMEARPNMSGKMKYSVTLLVPKTDTETINAILAANAEATADGMANKWNNKQVSHGNIPIYDGDASERPESQGCWEVRCSSDRAPGLVDANLMPIDRATNPDAIYSGCYIRADINVYPYAVRNPSTGAITKTGVAIGLNNVQKVEDGESLAGGRSAEAAFGAPDTATAFAASQPAAPAQAAPAPAAQPTNPVTPGNPFGA